MAEIHTYPNPKEDFFKTALNEETEVDSLLAYYRQKISSFENERFEWISRFEQLKLSKEEQHRNEWDLKRARDEIADLQRALSDARLKLFEERQIKLKILNENEQLSGQAVDDRRKIGELMNVCKPVEQKVVFRKNKKPSIMTKFVNNDLNIDFHKRNKRARAEKFLSDNSSKGMYKTVILPLEGKSGRESSMNLNSMGSEFEMEESQSIGSSRVLLEHVNSLRDELEKRERDIGNQREELNNQIEALMKKNEELEKLNIGLNKEFFAQRIKFEQIERKLQQENELLRLKNVSLANQLAETQKRAEVENKITKEISNKKSIEYANSFKNKCRRKEEKLAVVKDQYKKVQMVYSEKIGTLESNLKQLKKKYENLRKKKNLEISGYKSEIRNLRTQFKILLRDIELENWEGYEDILSENQVNNKKKKGGKKKKPRKGKKKQSRAQAQQYEDETIDIEDLDYLKSKMEDINNKLTS